MAGRQKQCVQARVQHFSKVGSFVLSRQRLAWIPLSLWREHLPFENPRRMQYSRHTTCRQFLQRSCSTETCSSNWCTGMSVDPELLNFPP